MKQASTARPIALILVMISMASVQVLAPWGLSAASATTSPVIDSYVQVNSVVVNSDRSITVKYRLKKSVRSQVNLALQWKYPAAARNSASYSRTSITGAAGNRTVRLAATRATPMVVRVQFSIARPNEQKDILRLVTPGKRTTGKTISRAEATGTAIAFNAPGVVLTYVPQSRVIRAVGAAVLGWTLWQDVRMANGAALRGCPRVVAGNYVQHITWTEQKGEYAVFKLRTRMWAKTVDFKRGARPFCDLTYAVGQYR